MIQTNAASHDAHLSSLPGAHPLDNVVWSALNSRHHAQLAIVEPHARRYPAAFAPFGAMREISPEGFESLAGWLAGDAQVALVTAGDVRPPPVFEVVRSKDMVQMVQIKPPVSLAAGAEVFQALGPADIPQMLALVDQTRPGPFGERTLELGRFLGLKVEGQLVAMAGERMHLDDYTEVSAVCTRDDFRGQGLARRLVSAVCSGIAARGETAILHAFTDNHGAIALYRELGFNVRATLRLTVLRLAPAG